VVARVKAVSRLGAVSDVTVTVICGCGDEFQAPAPGISLDVVRRDGKIKTKVPYVCPSCGKSGTTRATLHWEDRPKEPEPRAKR
jgi:hypothetical protein